MTVASVAYGVTPRIYFDETAVGAQNFDTLNVYKGVRALRRTTAEHQKYRPVIVAGGNVAKTEEKSTQPYVQLLHGCRMVPHDTSQSLRVIRDTFTDDGFEGRDCFDRTGLSPATVVDIDFDVDKVEIRTVATGGALTVDEKEQLDAIEIVTQAIASNQLSEERAKELMLNRNSTIENGKIVSYIAGGDVSVSVTYDPTTGLPTEEAIVEP